MIPRWQQHMHKFKVHVERDGELFELPCARTSRVFASSFYAKVLVTIQVADRVEL